MQQIIPCGLDCGFRQLPQRPHQAAGGSLADLYGTRPITPAAAGNKSFSKGVRGTFGVCLIQQSFVF